MRNAIQEHPMPKSDLHVCLIIGSLRMGGAERAILNLSNGFAERNIAVDLVLINKTGPYLSELDKRIRVIDMGKKKTMFSILGIARYFKQENPYAVIASQNHVQIAAMLAMRISGRKIPVIWNEHSTFSIHSARKKSVKNIIIRALASYFLPKAFAVTAVSKGVASDVLKYFKVDRQKVITIYNAVVTNSLQQLAAAEVNHPFFGNKEIPVILSIGRLTASKDFPTLIKAFALLTKKRQARLIIIGSGEELRHLKKTTSDLAIENYVSFPGEIKAPFAFLANASVFVLPSLYEGLSNVIIEALACGCPVVSTDCPNGPSEILEQGKFGKLVPVGNSKTLCEAIDEMLLHPTDKHMLTERANFFHVNQAVDSYMQLFKSIPAKYE